MKRVIYNEYIQEKLVFILYDIVFFRMIFEEGFVMKLEYRSAVEVAT